MATPTPGGFFSPKVINSLKRGYKLYEAGDSLGATAEAAKVIGAMML